MFGIKKKQQKVDNQIAGNTRGFYFGRSKAGKYVNERTALNSAAVLACIRLLATSVAGLPLHLYRENDDYIVEKATDLKLYTVLHSKPNDEMSAYDFKVAMMTQLLLFGNAYAQIIKNGKGEVMALYPLQSDRMVVDRYRETGSLFYKYTQYGDEAKTDGDTVSTKILQPSEVFHIKCMSFDGVLGISPIAMAKEAVGLAIATEEYGSAFFANGATPDGILKHPGVLKNPDRLRESWNATYGGSSKAHRIAIVEEGMSFERISSNAQESQMIETRKFQLGEIARIFGIPPHMIGDLEKSSFSNIEQQSRDFLENTLMPYLSEWESQINLKLISDRDVGKVYAKFNIDGRLRANYSERMSGYATAFQNGFMSVNDIRRLENMKPIAQEEGGDRYLCNGNMVPLDTAGNWNNNGTLIKEEEK